MRNVLYSLGQWKSGAARWGTRDSEAAGRMYRSPGIERFAWDSRASERMHGAEGQRGHGDAREQL